jgi:hypothetical protein
VNSPITFCAIALSLAIVCVQMIGELESKAMAACEESHSREVCFTILFN